MSDKRGVIIVFDYGGYYTIKGNESIWKSRENVHKSLILESCIEEVTYSGLVKRLLRKLKLDEGRTELILSYIPELVDPKRAIYISDDEDVLCYLSMNKDKFVVLHVEDKMVGEQTELVVRDGGCGIVTEENMIEACQTSQPSEPNEEPTEEPTKEPTKEPSQEPTEEPNEEPNEEVNEVFENDETRDVEMVVYQEQLEGHTTVEEEVLNPKGNVVKVEWEDGLNVTKHQEFGSKLEVKDLIESTAHKKCFQFDIVKSNKKLLVAKCKEFKRKGCPWHLRAALDKNGETFSVRVYHKMHTCTRIDTSTMTKSRNGTKRLVSSLLRDKYECMLTTPAPKDIIPLVQANCGVKVSYSTARRGKAVASHDARGSPEEGYKNVYGYLHMLKEVNPGTVTDVKLDEKKHFLYLFFALGACIEGFKSMRKVIIVDGTSIKTVHGGTLMIASAQDPDHHHYPVAFGVVDSENNDSLTWFFERLKLVIPDCPELVFCSDRNQSMIKAIGNVYPQAKHGYCIYHLSQNVKLNVSNVNRDEVATRFMQCGKAYTEHQFVKMYDAFCKAYPSAKAYLDRTVKQEKWARCYFPGERYNIDTTNVVESINGVLKLTARTYPLLLMLDAIVAKLGEWFIKYRKLSTETPEDKMLVPFVEKLLDNKIEEAKLLTVKELNRYSLEFQVMVKERGFVVDMGMKKCDCGLFQIDKYPCVHAIAVAMEMAKNLGKRLELHELCSHYYWLATWCLAYNKTIYPVPITSDWVLPDHVKELYALPKIYEKTRGRRQEQRLPVPGEHGRRKKNKSRSVGGFAWWFNMGV